MEKLLFGVTEDEEIALEELLDEMLDELMLEELLDELMLEELYELLDGMVERVSEMQRTVK